MEILEAYDLTGSYRGAAELVGCDHHTVARYVALRAAGTPAGERTARTKMIDEYLPKIEELVERSKGRVGPDVVHGEKITVRLDRRAYSPVLRQANLPAETA